jgi:hypothetical protein
MTRAQRIREYLGDGAARRVPEIRQHLGLTDCSLGQYKKVIAILSDLTRNGDLERVEKGVYRAAPKWRKAQGAGHKEEGRATKAEERMWLVMRQLPAFTADDIERLSEQSAPAVSSYIQALFQRDLVTVIATDDSGQLYQVLQSQILAPGGARPSWLPEIEQSWERIHEALIGGDWLGARMGLLELEAQVVLAEKGNAGTR